MAQHRPPRLSVSFSDEALAWLERESTKRAITISDLIRRLVDEVRGDRISAQQQKVREAA